MNAGSLMPVLRSTVDPRDPAFQAHRAGMVSLADDRRQRSDGKVRVHAGAQVTGGDLLVVPK